MAQLRWFQGFLLMILQLTVTAEQISVIKTAGDEVTLTCSKLVDQQKCNRTTWLFSESGNKPAIELVTLGKNKKTRHERLSLTANCSLVIKTVIKEDAGRYICQQWKQGNEENPAHQSSIYLSVTYRKVQPATKPGNKDSETTKPKTENASPTTKGKVQPTTKPGNRNPVTTKPTSTGNPVTTKTTPASRVSTASVTTTMTPGTNSTAIPFIAVPVVIVVVLAAAGLIIRWRAKGKKTGTDENAVKPEDNVAYATIRHAKGTKRKAKVAVNHDAVTYSTVTSCPSGATSEYPQNIYSIIVSNN